MTALVVETFENMRASYETLFPQQKMFLNLLGNIFAAWEANFVSATMFPEVGKQGNIDCSLPRALVLEKILQCANCVTHMPFY